MAAGKKTEGQSGKLRIGDMWNAITIIALSQNNPLKAVAEFVENSIDAHARHITIIRGKEGGQAHIRIKDDGEGVPLNEEGIPDFKYVATHVCDSIKRRMKTEGATGIQGEFGIGLLSFWTVGEQLSMSSVGRDGHTYEMIMQKGDQGYRIRKRRILLPEQGTELKVSPLLSGLRSMTGEKIQRYLASELRDRIRRTGVIIKVIDRTARKEWLVEPRRFAGRLLHELPPVRTSFGDVYVELYIKQREEHNQIGLYRSGTRVIPDLTNMDEFTGFPWSSEYLEGLIDAPFIRLTPGTRDGIIHDAAYEQFTLAMQMLCEPLTTIIDAQRAAEEQRASKQMLKTVQKALKEAILSLPDDEYDWFDLHREKTTAVKKREQSADEAETEMAFGIAPTDSDGDARPTQKAFFEYEGPLYSVKILPQSVVVRIGQMKTFRALPRDHRRNAVEKNMRFEWSLLEGGGALESGTETTAYTAPETPGLTRIGLKAFQDDLVCEAEALVTITDSIESTGVDAGKMAKGLPGYTFKKAPGELWRSSYDETRNVIIINNGHKDFVYASAQKSRQLRYISRLFSKELVVRNFADSSAEQQLERLIELNLYMEDNLR